MRIGDLGLFWASSWGSGIASVTPLLPEKAGWFAVGLSSPPSFRALLLAGGVPFFPTTTVLRTLSKSRTQVDEGRIRSEVANASSRAEIRMQPCFLWYSFF